MRKRIMKAACLIGSGCILLAGTFSASAEISGGELMANSCFTCHGPQGSGAESMPPIKDYSQDELISILTDFQEGERAPTVMDRHATGYTDEQIRAIAEYLSELDQ